MNGSKHDVAQLRRRDPRAWTALLNQALVTEKVSVTGVNASPLGPCPSGRCRQRPFRYTLALADHSDPITLIGKRTNQAEVSFYRELAPNLPRLAPRCFLTVQSGDKSWLLIEDVPDHFPPHKWTPADVEEITEGLASLHASFWNQGAALRQLGMPALAGRKRYEWQELRASQKVLFEEGPGAVLSEHAVHSAGRLAPLFLQAANGLTLMRDLGGWPGVLGESHLAAAADLLDDPVPILEPLRRLPSTLIHGDPYSYHWRLTLFDELRLLDWQNAAVGPGIFDLILFLEQLGLLYEKDTRKMRLRQEQLATEETVIDGYLLSMSARLGPHYNARAARQAIPAGRCLFVLTHWLARFATWFSAGRAPLPSKYTWQRVNRMGDSQLVGTTYEPLVALRPHLRGVFARFLRAYRTL